MLFFIKGHTKNRSVVDQYIINLMKHYRMHTRKSGQITVRFTKDMGDGCDHYLASCIGDRRNAYILINKNQSFMSQMRALAHEMVHAKQFLRGELDESGTVWKGINCDGMKYGTEPYEVEAYGYEDDLFMATFPFDLI